MRRGAQGVERAHLHWWLGIGCLAAVTSGLDVIFAPPRSGPPRGLADDGRAADGDRQVAVGDGAGPSVYDWLAGTMEPGVDHHLGGGGASGSARFTPALAMKFTRPGPWARTCTVRPIQRRVAQATADPGVDGAGLARGLEVRAFSPRVMVSPSMQQRVGTETDLRAAARAQVERSARAPARRPPPTTMLPWASACRRRRRRSVLWRSACRQAFALPIEATLTSMSPGPAGRSRYRRSRSPWPRS